MATRSPTKYERSTHLLRIVRVIVCAFISGPLLLPINTFSAFEEEQRVWNLRHGEWELTEDGWTYESADLWHIAKPNIRREHTVKNNGRIAFRATYTTDENGLRRLDTPNIKRRPHQVFFYGCSFVFGQGVEDHETLSFYFAQEAPQSYPIDLSHPGYGTQQLLVKMENQHLLPQLPEKQQKRTLIYPFPGFHIRRNIGAMELVIHWTKGFAYYYLDRNGDLVRDGDFETGRPITTAIYRLFWKSGLAPLFNLRIPPRETESDYLLTAKLIEKSFRLFKEKHQGDEAYVIFYPSAAREYVEPMKRHFKNLGINYLDYSSLVDMHDPLYTIAGDNHPTPLTNKILAARIAEDLGLSGKP